MGDRVAVLIPTLNEDQFIVQSVGSAWAAGAAEVIVSDGGSRDQTVERARSAGARTLTSENRRSRQLNDAALAANADHLIFLHADTLLPAKATELVAGALGQGCVFGGFRLGFRETQRPLRLVESMINLRSRFTRCPWGDQAQFINRELFHRIGGFRDIAIMEDYDLAVRMKKMGKTIILPATIQTSGRRFIETGIVRTTAMNWVVIAGYRLGWSPEKLALLYRGSRGGSSVQDRA